MQTKAIYYIILFVYILLWACEVVVCHMTHSLVILTDSYINLYKILDISLGILHLCTQQELAKNRVVSSSQPGPSNAGSLKEPALAGRLFNCICTYQFKRLPLLGSFMNGLFLAALLMSAAIEGIQTCVHSSHSQSAEDRSILHRDPLTYPFILVGFALVGLMMQHCSLRAHQMREEELQSESLLDLSGRQAEVAKQKQFDGGAIMMRELNANNLERSSEQRGQLLVSSGKRQSYDLNLLQRQISTTSISSKRLKSRQSSLQELPMSLAEREIPNNHETRVSLKSLRLAVNLESIVPPISEPIGSISRDLEAPNAQLMSKPRPPLLKDNWFLVRYLTSPLALLAYATITYSLPDENRLLYTEISDSTLSICVVLLLFAASYPPMKKAGRVLLQTAPDGVDLIKLEKELAASSDLILEVQNLHVWSLTPRSNRVASCQLVLDKSLAGNMKQVALIMSEARYKFLDQNIKCTTIEPKFKPDSQPGEEGH